MAQVVAPSAIRKIELNGIPLGVCQFGIVALLAHGQQAVHLLRES